MSSESTEFNESLEAYLDGTLPAGPRAAFERELETNASLAASLAGAVALQGRIDGAVRKQFDVASMTAPPLPEAASAAGGARGRRWCTRPVRP